MFDLHGPNQLRKIELFDMKNVNMKDIVSLGYQEYKYLTTSFSQNKRRVVERKAWAMFFVDITGEIVQFGKTRKEEDAEDTVYKLSNLLNIDEILGPVPMPGV